MGSPSVAGGKRGGMAEHHWGVGSGRGVADVLAQAGTWR